MGIRERIIKEYQNLPDGAVMTSQLCPKCNGGGTKEKSLSVGRTSFTLWWKCHRASCHHGGKETMLSELTGDPSLPKLAKPKVLFTTYPITNHKYLEARYRISEKVQKIFKLEWCDYLCCDPHMFPRIAVPLLNRDLTKAGTLLRATEYWDIPKAIIVKDKDPMGVVWFNCTSGPSSNVVIVEDCWSALRMTEHMNAVALLGTNISPEQIDELRSFRMKNYFLCLDKDAFNLSINYATKYKNKIKLEVVSLSNDIKNMHSTSEFPEFLTRLKEISDGQKNDPSN